jgi:hypothetical protein
VRAIADLAEGARLSLCLEAAAAIGRILTTTSSHLVGFARCARFACPKPKPSGDNWRHSQQRKVGRF